MRFYIFYVNLYLYIVEYLHNVNFVDVIYVIILIIILLILKIC